MEKPGARHKWFVIITLNNLLVFGERAQSSVTAEKLRQKIGERLNTNSFMHVMRLSNPLSKTHVAKGREASN